MTDEQLKTIGQFVVWLEQNGSNIHQTFAHSIIASAEEWKQSQQSTLKNNV